MYRFVFYYSWNAHSQQKTRKLFLNTYTYLSIYILLYNWSELLKLGPVLGIRFDLNKGILNLQSPNACKVQRSCLKYYNFNHWPLFWNVDEFASDPGMLSTVVTRASLGIGCSPAAIIYRIQWDTHEHSLIEKQKKLYTTTYNSFVFVYSKHGSLNDSYIPHRDTLPYSDG